MPRRKMLAQVEPRWKYVTGSGESTAIGAGLTATVTVDLSTYGTIMGLGAVTVTHSDGFDESAITFKHNNTFSFGLTDTGEYSGDCTYSWTAWILVL